MSYVRDKISSFEPQKYNQFYWWRRFKIRKTLHPYAPLYDKIKNGDYEASDYFYQAKYELELMEEKLSTIKNVDEQHEVRGLCLERYRRLMKDYEKDETSIMKALYKDFKTTFKVSEEQLEEYMEKCEGTLIDLYDIVKKDYLNKHPEREHLV